jgi:hypothetical protein
MESTLAVVGEEEEKGALVVSKVVRMIRVGRWQRRPSSSTTW